VTSLERLTALVARRLESGGIRYMVIGGVANAVWGVARATIDVDVTVLLDPERVDQLLEALGEEFTPRSSDPEGLSRRTRVVPVVHSSGVQVDIILALLPYEEEAVSRAVAVRVGGTPVRFCTAEDLILHKIISTRDRDLADVEALLLARGGRLDRSYLDPRVHELAVLLDRPELEQWYLERPR
jgi:predicted nucleotidyltransferase